MPGVNGTEICARLRKGNTKDYVYVILLSSHGEKKDLIEGMAAGADDYIIKPFDPEELNARLRAAKRILDLQLELSAANGNLEARVAAPTVEVEQLLTQKNQFVNQLGHDLKTPLTPLVALLPRLAKRTSDERSLKLLSLMMENVAYMPNLVERTLTLAHLNQVSEDLDLADVDIQPPIVSTLMTVSEEAESPGMTLFSGPSGLGAPLPDRLILPRRPRAWSWRAERALPETPGGEAHQGTNPAPGRHRPNSAWGPRSLRACAPPGSEPGGRCRRGSAADGNGRRLTGLVGPSPGEK